MKLHAFVFALWIARGEAKNQGIWGPIKEANNKIEEIGNLMSLMIRVGEMEERLAVAEVELKKKPNQSDLLEVDVRTITETIIEGHHVPASQLEEDYRRFKEQLGKVTPPEDGNNVRTHNRKLKQVGDWCTHSYAQIGEIPPGAGG